MTTATIFTDIRMQLRRIPAGQRSADEYAADVWQTLSALEATRVMEMTPAKPEPLRLREGAWYRDRAGNVRGPIKLDALDQRHPYLLNDSVWSNWFSENGSWISGGKDPDWRDLIAEVPAPVAPEVVAAEQRSINERLGKSWSPPNTICTPTVPVTVGRNTQIVDPDTGCLTELGAALLNGIQAQIAELRRLVEGK